MDALMCYQTPLMSERPITHFTHIWMLKPIDVTGISAFRTVYMKLLIQSNLVKSQRLNIRIYFERKYSYFYSNVNIKKNPLCLKNCDIYKCVQDDFQFFYNPLFKIKHQLLHLRHTYFQVLYEMHFGIFFQQLRNVKAFEYFDHTK